MPAPEYFIVEKKGKLTLIEAKSGERLNEKKLNFKKVKPLLEGKSEVKAMLLQNISDQTIINKTEFRCFNPLHTDIDL